MANLQQNGGNSNQSESKLQYSKLNSYSLTAQLRKVRRRTLISATAQALFHELIAICNEEGWAPQFRCSNAELMNAINITEKTLIQARNTLIESGLIIYHSGKSKREFSLYSLISTTGNFTANDTANDTTTVESAGNFTANKGANTPDLYKHKPKETISINRNKNFPFRKSLIDYGFDEPLVNDWIKVREKHKAVNTETAFKGFISEVEKSSKPKNEILKIMIEGSWRSFKAEWLEDKNKKQSNKNQESLLSFEKRENY